MNRTDRLYAMTEQLRAAGPAGRTAAWLAARYEVSTRTVKRDVTALQEAGLPIWGTGGPGGGYVLDERASLPPLTFTAGEAVAVATALASRPVLPFGPEGRSALDKVLAALPTERRAEVEALADRVWIRTPADTARTPASRTIDEAVRSGCVVVLDYVDGDGVTTTRRAVEPLAYALNRDQWYLLAWCRRRRAGRWFRVDRIQRAVLTTESFEARSLRDVFGEPPGDVGPVPI
jgi:predicted DNA-binding transcriptional regulator YafY